MNVKTDRKGGDDEDDDDDDDDVDNYDDDEDEDDDDDDDDDDIDLYSTPRLAIDRVSSCAALVFSALSHNHYLDSPYLT